MKDGRLGLSDNRAERSIRSIVIGRRNWLFADTPRGAEAGAIIYSIVETAKANALNPSAYLNHVFEAMPNIDLDDPAAVVKLLPYSDSWTCTSVARSRELQGCPMASYVFASVMSWGDLTGQMMLFIGLIQVMTFPFFL
jgi:hypothetical protein